MKVVRVPKEERLKFEVRAATHFPNEVEDYLIGEVRRDGLDVHLILPTRGSDIEEQSAGTVTLRKLARDRAVASARNLGLRVLGSVHTHPYKRWNGYGVCLSKTDYENWNAGGLWSGPDFIESPVVAVCAIYRRGINPDKFSCFWRYWQKTKPLGIPWDDVPPFLGPENRTV